MQWQTQASNITTNLKVEINFARTEFSATKIVMWDCHVDDSDKYRYNMILGRDLFKTLLLNTHFSEHVIEAGDGLLK